LVSVGSVELRYKGLVELDASAKIIRFHYPNMIAKWWRQRLVLQPQVIPFQEITLIYQSEENVYPSRFSAHHRYCLRCRTIFQFDYALLIVNDAEEMNRVLDVFRQYFDEGVVQNSGGGE